MEDLIMKEKNPALYKNKQKEFILKALTDPSFRKMLIKQPEKALGRKNTTQTQKEIKIVLAVVKGIEAQIANIADELLCLNGNGPCGIA